MFVYFLSNAVKKNFLFVIALKLTCGIGAVL